MTRATILLSCLALLGPPGPAQQTSTRLPTGWRIAPAGESFPLSTSPVYARLLPDGKRALILHSGYRPPSLVLADIPSRRILSSVELADAGFDMAFDAEKLLAYVPTGHDSAVAVVGVEQNQLVEKARYELSWPGNEYPRSHAASITIDASRIFVVETEQDSVAVLDRASGKLVRRLQALSRPTRAVVHEGRLYVATMGSNEVLVYGAETGENQARAAVSAGPADLLVWKNRLYVAASNSNFLDVVDLSDPSQPKAVERLNLAPAPNWPVGMTPSALSLDAAASRLFVVCSDANAAAVVDVAEAKPRVAGYLPTGWYPTFALPLPEAGVLVLNAKGNRSYPNPKGPNPSVHRRMTPQPPSDIEYTPLIQLGSAQVIERLDAASLRAHTETVYRITPTPKLPRGHKLPRQIEHVIFIMKENRTYDQVLGDLPRGNGDPSLCLFPEEVSPNHHKLAMEFTLFDNFYVNADVSSEGWYWTSAAITPHFVMKNWPAAYAGRARPQSGNASARAATQSREAGEEEDPLERPPGGYLWTRALAAKLSFRNYGFFATNRPNARPGEDIVVGVRDPTLLPFTNRRYAGYDPGFPDLERARVFLEDLAAFEKAAEMPRLIMMVLPNDHTFGTAPGKLTPFSSVADNDAALGKIVEAVSRSRFWPTTAIFVVEDDAQNGPDHVDSHRAPMFLISPYTRRGFVDSNFYNTTSVLRTIEMILGLEPLTHYDATAPPILGAFQSKPDLTPYEAEAPRVSLTDVNPPRSETTARSEKLDLSEPDRIDDHEMNEILWLAVKGTVPPPPTTSVFLTAR